MTKSLFQYRDKEQQNQSPSRFPLNTQSKSLTSLHNSQYTHDYGYDSSLIVPTTDQSSNYRRYLLLETQSDDQAKQINHRPIKLLESCVLYLKRQLLNQSFHDGILYNMLKPHFDLKRLEPTPISQIGQYLITSGYFLAAYALMVIRLRSMNNNGQVMKKFFISTYKRYEIQANKEQMLWYLGSDYYGFDVDLSSDLETSSDSNIWPTEQSKPSECQTQQFNHHEQQSNYRDKSRPIPIKRKTYSD